MKKYTQETINKKYPCGNAGRIQYRVICQEHYEDIKKLNLEVKCFWRLIPQIKSSREAESEKTEFGKES